ncbi:bifunctional pyr operon transcriptional regulator/uracil phosphoribosyltransferase PyrR [Rariglobus hedericola]|uniref:Bifunctional pyr operon transcriptional regulator/uracil phosphoribosyltransferase PyrR n=1 Tax=Rariglobus hedericola TaxID=2597822 RepID=A0A556QQH4_9BACT|nr:bifunctional pyr operon transcriptional regulator/uracil phosphoribosyltransferase PyrR [Rariglobus hedericola]TSJ78890.1 bifunctional pyr operon transcriptional regulator/uracil phosphoribosyltransferase PyrR [Rariglobus hedericola]
MPAPKSLPAAEIQAAIDRLAQAIGERHAKTKSLILLGIANGGIELARRLALKLGVKSGVLDISFHRDDIDRNPIPKEFVPTLIPVDVTGATVVLVDDVLFSGRTVKAALDELFDHGRPAKVELAILIDRGGRKLPVAADYTGLTFDVTSACKIVVQLDTAKPPRDSVTILPSKPAAK